LVASRTKGVSAAFIKELMRRCAQFQIEFSSGKILTQRSVDAAIEEMLFTGGTLNRRLLGGEGADTSRLSTGPSYVGCPTRHCEDRPLLPDVHSFLPHAQSRNGAT